MVSPWKVVCRHLTVCQRCKQNLRAHLGVVRPMPACLRACKPHAKTRHACQQASNPQTLNSCYRSASAVRFVLSCCKKAMPASKYLTHYHTAKEMQEAKTCPLRFAFFAFLRFGLPNPCKALKHSLRSVLRFSGTPNQGKPCHTPLGFRPSSTTLIPSFRVVTVRNTRSKGAGETLPDPLGAVFSDTPNTTHADAVLDTQLGSLPLGLRNCKQFTRPPLPNARIVFSPRFQKAQAQGEPQFLRATACVTMKATASLQDARQG